MITPILKPTQANRVSWADDTNLNPNESDLKTLTTIRNIHWMGDKRAIDLESNEGLQRPGIWGEEWTDEERIRRGKEAYEREEIEEVDYNLVEAIPPEALEEELEVKLPEKIFGPETLRRSTRRLLERFVRIFSKKLRKEAAKVSPLKIVVDKKL